MDLSEEDQRVAVSAASAMSLKRSISSLDLAADARAARARRSAQPSNKEGLEDPTLETPLKDTGLPPFPPSPPIDVRILSDPEAWTRWLRRMDRVAQLQGLLLYTPEALDLEEFRKGMGKSGGGGGEGASDKHPMFDVPAMRAEYDKKMSEMKAKRAQYLQQYRARPEVKAKKNEYDKQYYARPEVKAKRARPEVKEKKAEYDKKRYMSRREYRSKRAEYEKQYIAEFDQMVAEYMARPEVKAKRATKDAAEQAETSTLRGKTYCWDTLYEVIKLEDVPLPMQCPQHSRGE